jgi:Cu2+-exporting ATPase
MPHTVADDHPSAAAAETRACDHCGDPAVFRVEDHAFCCPGCQHAFAWIGAAGLSDYYEVRSALGQTGRKVHSDGREHDDAYLDDPVYLASLGQQPGSATINVVGMHCAACVWLIEQLPTILPGLGEARVNLGAGKVHFRWDPQLISLAKVAGTLRGLGYRIAASDHAATLASQKKRRQDLLRMALCGAFAGNTMLVSIALYAGDVQGMEGHYHRLFAWASALLALPCVTYGAWPFFRAAWIHLRHRRLHLDLPIAIGVFSAYSASLYSLLTGGSIFYFDSVAMLVFLLLIGRFIQSRGQIWALSQAGALHLLLPPSARKAQSDGRTPFVSVPALSLQPGDQVRVLSGERFPADGQVIAGESFVDASSLTGEAHPIAIGPGGSALAGTTNLTHAIDLRVQATGEQTRIGSLARQLSQDHHEKSSIQSFVDRISVYFVAAVLSTAACGGLVWWWLDASRIFEVVLSVLVVTCPCALGMATPLALAGGRREAAQHGFVLARASALEDLAHIKRVVFDKTGTLTEGRLEVAAIWSDLAPAALAAIVHSLESTSSHPIARSLLRWNLDASRTSLPVSNLVEIPGQGVSGKISDVTYRLGRFDDAIHDQRLQRFEWQREALLARENGQTVIFLENETRLVAAFALADTLRHGVRSTLAALKKRGFELSILSGDHPSTVAALARSLDIADAHGGLSPEDKSTRLAQKAPCVMVGDGVNDAPALSQATVGIAMGGAAQIAMRVADVYVPRPDFVALDELFRGATRSLAVIHRNLAFALVYNVVFAIAALLDAIDPLAAAILMPISSLSVIVSSLSARPFGPRRHSRELASAASAVANAESITQPLQA